MQNYLKNKKLNSALVSVFAILVALSSFQNCGQKLFRSQSDQKEKTPEQKIAGTESNIYHAIRFDASENLTGQNSNGTSAFGTTRLNIELTKSEVIYSKFGVYPVIGAVKPETQELCTLDEVRRKKLVGFLTDSTICNPVPPEISCMAIAVTDIILYTATGEVELTPVICGRGAFLCDDRDAKFRAVLIDIKNKKPAAENCRSL